MKFEQIFSTKLNVKWKRKQKTFWKLHFVVEIYPCKIVSMSRWVFSMSSINIYSYKLQSNISLLFSFLFFSKIHYSCNKISFRNNKPSSLLGNVLWAQQKKNTQRTSQKSILGMQPKFDGFSRLFIHPCKFQFCAVFLWIQNTFHMTH